MSEVCMSLELAKDTIKAIWQVRDSNEESRRLYDACREIIRLNEVIEGMKADVEFYKKVGDDVNEEVHVVAMGREIANSMSYKFICSVHNREMYQIRPGKWQCPECE